MPANPSSALRERLGIAAPRNGRAGASGGLGDGEGEEGEDGGGGGGEGGLGEEDEGGLAEGGRAADRAATTTAAVPSAASSSRSASSQPAQPPPAKRPPTVLLFGRAAKRPFVFCGRLSFARFSDGSDGGDDGGVVWALRDTRALLRGGGGPELRRLLRDAVRAPPPVPKEAR